MLKVGTKASYLGVPGKVTRLVHSKKTQVTLALWQADDHHELKRVSDAAGHYGHGARGILFELDGSPSRFGFNLHPLEIKA